MAIFTLSILNSDFEKNCLSFLKSWPRLSVSLILNIIIIKYLDNSRYQGNKLNFIVLGSLSNIFLFQQVLISRMVTLSSYLICQIIRFILPPNEYGCVYASLSGPAIDLQKMPILAKKIMYVKKKNCSIWGTENRHAYIEKSTHPKRVTVWCGFLSRGIIGPFFFENE